MKKSKKVIIFIIYFMIIILGILYFYSPEIIWNLILPKYHIKFDNLEKVIISYNPSNSAYQEYHTIADYPELENIPACQIEVTDKSFIKLIKDNYENKIVTKYKYKLLSFNKGNFEIIINDTTSICVINYNDFFIVHKDTFFPIEYNQEIFDKITQFVINNGNSM